MRERGLTDLDRRTLFRAGFGAAAAGGLLLAGTPTADAAPRKGRTLAKDLRVPWGLAFLPGGDALVGERPSGVVHRVSRRGGRKRVGDVAGVADHGEGGLLGLALSPGFADDRLVYAYLTSRSDNRIVRLRYRDGRLRDQRLVLGDIPAARIHNGGRIAFGPDGMLYAGTGDAADDDLAQDTGSLAGKILRIRPDGGVPAGNPFGSHVWSYGHRNVQGLAWDSRGTLWATEFGQSTRDELNRIVKGGNYGWPEVEGGDGQGGFRDPFVTWRPTSTCSPSGVAIAKGRAWVGALAGHCLYSVRLFGDNKRKITRHFHEDFGRIRTVQKAPDGSLWITTSNRDGRGDPGANDDRVIRVVL